MAYPEITGPYGFKPVNLVGGQYVTGAFRQIPIASGYSTDIFNGDMVDLTTTGTLVKNSTGTATATTVGIFIGCAYTDPNLKYFIQKQYYPEDTAASDIVGYVVDDPNQLFKVAVVSATTVISYLTRAAVGLNATIVQNVGSTDTGNSKNAIDDTVASTASLPLRVIDVVPETSYEVNTSGTTYETRYREVICKWNLGTHRYQNATGVT